MRTIAFATLVYASSLVPAAGQVIAVNSIGGTVSLLSAEEISKLSPVATEVLAADAKWADAYRTCDMKLMDSVLHDDLIFIHGHARVDSKQILMKVFGACNGGTRPTLTQPIRVVVVGPDAAVVEAAMTLGPPTHPIKSFYTRVYVRQGGNWRLIANQTTRRNGTDADGRPLPNPEADAQSSPAGGVR